MIDEIQMLRDPGRSWAWTRALLGLNADEVHVCGEVSAVQFVKELVEDIGDQFELKTYKRLTALRVAGKALGACDCDRNYPCKCHTCEEHLSSF